MMACVYFFKILCGSRDARQFLAVTHDFIAIIALLCKEPLRTQQLIGEMKSDPWNHMNCEHLSQNAASDWHHSSSRVVYQDLGYLRNIVPESFFVETIRPSGTYKYLHICFST